MIEQAVVLGGSGGLGKAVVDALISRNIPTKVLVRDIEKFKSLYPDNVYPGKVNVLEGDMDNNQALAVACEHTDTIFVCFKPPHTKLAKDMPRWISRVADIGAALGARIMYPGNMSNYGETDAKRITEEHPQNAPTNTGQLSIVFEQRLARAIPEGASLTIIRFPHIFGPAVINDLMYPVFSSAFQNKPSTWYGQPFLDHEFLYNMDAGEAMVLAALSPAAADTILHFPGIVLRSHDWLDKIHAIAGSTSTSYNLKKKWVLGMKSIFSSSTPEFKELLYLFENSLLLDGSKFDNIVGKIERTPMEEAIKSTLDWYRYWLE